MIIKLNNSTGHDQEYCILEFQGEMIGHQPGMELGQILIRENDIVSMEIGQHLLEGSIITLKNPFMIAQTIQSPHQTIDDNSSGLMDVMGLVHKKIIFKTRPKPKPLKSLS